jgi:hypothetical protein
MLAKYTSELKPGMSCEQAEQRLQTDGKRLNQMCCVASFSGEHVSLVGASWDDLVKIGEESPLGQGLVHVLQQQFLYAPVQQFGDIQFVLGRASHFMNPTKLAQLLARLAEHA